MTTFCAPLVTGTLVALLLVAGPIALAQPPPPSLGESLTGRAKDDYKTALLLYEDRDYTGAMVKFKSAHDQSGDPRLLWNIAACEKNLRHYVRVLTIVERYRRETAGRLTEDRRKEVEALLDTVRSLVSTVHLAVDEAGASVFVDDELAGTTPLGEALRVDLGRRRLRVSKHGFKDQLITQDFAGGSEVTFDLTMQAAPPEGRLTIEAGGKGTISLDGKVVGEGRWDGPVPSGSHAVRITAPGMRPFATAVVVGDGETRTLYPTLEAEKAQGLPALVWVAGSILVAGGLGTGAYFLFRPGPAAPAPTTGTLSPGTIQLPLTFH